MARGLARKFKLSSFLTNKALGTRKLKKQMKERKKKDYWMGKSEEDDVSPPPVAVAYLASTLLPSPRAAPPRPAGPRLLKRVHVYLAALILTIPYLILRGPRCPGWFCFLYFCLKELSGTFCASAVIPILRPPPLARKKQLK